jgi:Lrp/AsnC family transcriptional regulator for asnA, asnC and gidA
MDELDHLIVEELTEDARKSFRSIALKAGKATDTVINHFNKLVEEGVIRGSTLVMNIGKIGYEGMAVFHLDSVHTDDVNPDTILGKLIEMPNIIVATRTMGKHDLLALAVVHNLKHYGELGREISEIDGVMKMESSIWAAEEPIHPQYFII